MKGLQSRYQLRLKRQTNEPPMNNWGSAQFLARLWLAQLINELNSSSELSSNL